MKTCEHCGQPYEKRRNEAPSQYAKRRFCSRPCADKGRARVQVAPALNPQRRAEGVMNVPAQAAAATRIWLAHHRQGAAA